MNYQHKELAAGRWDKFSFLEQVANIGSEVERAISWREKNNEEYAKLAFYRSLELFDLTMRSKSITYPHLKEIGRAREAWVDFFAYDNIYHSTKELWRKYFMQLLMLLRNKEARKNR